MNKIARYKQLRADINAVLAGEQDLIACCATISCLLWQAFPERFIWAGFYFVDPGKKSELVVGPYQGTLGCLRIPFGKGVCGVAAQSGVTQLVENVHEFPGHIACDSRTNSEIVVPVFVSNGALLGVLDVDSEKPAEFDRTDQEQLEALINETFAQGRGK